MELRKLSCCFITELFLGSLDRFMAYILEETKGNLPLWLAHSSSQSITSKNEYHLECLREAETYQLLQDEGLGSRNGCSRRKIRISYS